MKHDCLVHCNMDWNYFGEPMLAFFGVVFPFSVFPFLCSSSNCAKIRIVLSCSSMGMG